MPPPPSVPKPPAPSAGPPAPAQLSVPAEEQSGAPGERSQAVCYVSTQTRDAPPACTAEAGHGTENRSAAHLVVQLHSLPVSQRLLKVDLDVLEEGRQVSGPLFGLIVGPLGALQFQLRREQGALETQ